jgi:hypothetical protein
MLTCLSFVSSFALVASAATASTTKLPKRGLAYAADNVTDIFKGNATASVASWVYNWGLVPPPYLEDSGIEYIPMQWGAADIDKLAVTVKGLGAKTILVLFKSTELFRRLTRYFP